MATVLWEASRLFKMTPGELRRQIRGMWWHDWSRDRFSRGAYSYLAVEGEAAVERLREPIEETVFFAGEALAAPGELGTVHGAVESGWRAAESVLVR